VGQADGLDRDDARKTQSDHDEESHQGDDENETVARLGLTLGNSDVAEIFSREIKLREPEEHSNSGGRKTKTPATLREGAADDWTQGRAKVDAHIEYGESRVAAGAAFGVKFADHGADVRLEQASARDD
jgi:hypothetical protein